MKMKIFQYIKSHLIISFILLLVIMSIIMLPIYFLVINKSGSQSPAQTPEYILPNIDVFDEDTLRGFMELSSTNVPRSFTRFEIFFKDRATDIDNGIINEYGVQYKWKFDRNNISKIRRIVSLLNKTFYTHADLSELDAGSKYYSFNQVIPIYDVNNPNFSKEDNLMIAEKFQPYIITTYGNYKKLSKIE